MKLRYCRQVGLVAGSAAGVAVIVSHFCVCQHASASLALQCQLLRFQLLACCNLVHGAKHSATCLCCCSMSFTSLLTTFDCLQAAQADSSQPEEKQQNSHNKAVSETVACSRVGPLRSIYAWMLILSEAATHCHQLICSCVMAHAVNSYQIQDNAGCSIPA